MKNYKEIVREMETINAQINGCSDAEQRESLKAQYESLKRESEIAREKQQSEIIARQAASVAAPARKMMNMREMIAIARKEGSKEFVLGREEAGSSASTPTPSTGVSQSVLVTGDTNNLVSAGAVPTNIKALLPLLDNAIVYNQLGINIATGVRGNIVWPVLSAGTTVTVNGEKAEISDSKIDFSKIEATPKRLGVSCFVTYEAMDNASFDVQSVVEQNLTHALAEYLNSAVLRTTAVDGGLNGPLTVSGVNTSTFSGATPTFAELIAMKGKVAKNNVQMVGTGYVMNNDMYAALESATKANNQNGFVIENGKIGAYPVFVTEAIAANKVAFGCFGYAALNNHGETRLAIENVPTMGGIRITLNSNWSLTTLRNKAFCLGTATV